MIIDELKKSNIEAMKARDQISKDVLSVVLTKCKLLELELKATEQEFKDSDVLSVIQKVIKELGDEKAGYIQVNNQERASLIAKQEEVLKKFLPKQLSEEEIKIEIEKLEDKSVPNVMKYFKNNFAGQVDMSLVNKVLKGL